MRLQAAFRLFFTIILMQYPCSVFADDGITISKVSSKISDKIIRVDCDISYNLDNRVKEALRNGIEMSFMLEIELRQQSLYWLGSLLSHIQREYRVKYHALSKQFVMVEIDNHTELSFPDLYSAFYYQSKLRNAELITIGALDLEQEYYFRVRARLVSEDLPLPLRIKSYVSTDWRPSSGWTTWPM